MLWQCFFFFFFSSRRRHTRWTGDWSSDVCSSDLVGWELAHTLAPLGEVIAIDREDVDFAVPDRIAPVVRSVRPEVLINAAAYTAVDRAESEPDAAYAINAAAVAILADEAKRVGALF